METVAISPKFQVVIPKAVRQKLGLLPGQRMQVNLRGDKVELQVEKTLQSLKGRWPGLDTKVVREADRKMMRSKAS
jgi:AbrB family looped-hinge helix DNA binding protein